MKQFLTLLLVVWLVSIFQCLQAQKNSRKVEISIQPSVYRNPFFSHDGSKIICRSGNEISIIDRRSGLHLYTSPPTFTLADMSIDFSAAADTIIYPLIGNLTIQHTKTRTILATLDGFFSLATFLGRGHKLLSIEADYVKQESVDREVGDRRFNPDALMENHAFYYLCYYSISKRKLLKKALLDIPKSASVKSVSVSINERYMAIDYSDGDDLVSSVFELPSGDFYWSSAFQPGTTDINLALTADGRPVNEPPVFSSTGDRVMFRLGKNKIRDVSIAEKKSVVREHDREILAYGYSSQGQPQIIDCLGEPFFLHTPRFKNLTTGQVNNLQQFQMTIRSASFSPDGAHVILDCQNYFQLTRLTDLVTLPNISVFNSQHEQGYTEVLGVNQFMRVNSFGPTIYKRADMLNIQQRLPVVGGQTIVMGNQRKQFCVLRKDTIELLNLDEYIAKQAQPGFRAQKTFVDRLEIFSINRQVFFDESRDRLFILNATFGGALNVYNLTDRGNALEVKLEDDFDKGYHFKNFGAVAGADFCYVLARDKGLLKLNLTDKSLTEVDMDDQIASIATSPDGTYLIVYRNNRLEIRLAKDYSLTGTLAKNISGFYTRFKVTHDNQYVIAEDFVHSSSSTDEEIPTLSVFKLQNKGLQQEVELPQGNPVDFDVYYGNTIWVSFSNGDVRLVNIGGTANRHLATVNINPEGGMIIYTPDGYYLTDSYVAQNINLSFRDELVKSSQLDLYMNRPDIVTRRLPGSTKEVRNYYSSICKMRFKYNQTDSTVALSRVTIPKLQIVNKSSIPETTPSASVQVSVDVSDEEMLSTLHVFVNGMLVQTINDINQKTYRRDFNLVLSSGYNRIHFLAINSKNYRSNEDAVQLIYTGIVQPDLYLIAVGISNYASNDLITIDPAERDVDTLVNIFKTKEGGFYRRVHTLVLKGDEFSLNSPSVIEKFISQTGPEDRVIFYFEGHGLWDKSNLKYYLSTKATELNDLEHTAVTLETLKHSVSTSSSRNVLVLLNACFAGERDPEQQIFEGMRQSFLDLRIHSGLHIITTSGGLTQSQFITGQNNTYLISMLNEIREAPGVDIIPFYNHLNQYLMRESFGRQSANYMQYNVFNYFRIW